MTQPLQLPVILIVDDNANDRELLQHLLRLAGVANPLRFAEDGESAISVLREYFPAGAPLRPGGPALIFLDVNMPRGGGFRVLEWIRQEPALRGTRVVMVTDSDNPSDIRRAEELKAGYLLKHPHPDTIAYVVRHAMDSSGERPV